MKKIKTIFIGAFLISLLFMLISGVQVGDCTDETLIYGKVYFYGHETDSQVINATIEVYDTDVSGPTQHKLANTTTNSIGEYAINISSDMTSQNMIFYVKAKYPDLIQTDGYRHFCYKSANVSCGNSSEVNFVVDGCYGLSLPTTVKGKIVKVEGLQEISVPGEKTTVYVLVRGEGGGNFSILNTKETNWTGNDSNYKLSVATFQILNPCPTYTDVNWPTEITVWMDPYQNHYYRCWSANDFKKNCTKSIKCGDDPEIKFYVLMRKNNTQNCSHNDECLSNFCNQLTNKCEPAPCDLDGNGIYIHDYNDLMTAYKCFLGITKNCKINYQEWNLMKKEYECFTGNDA